MSEKKWGELPCLVIEKIGRIISRENSYTKVLSQLALNHHWLEAIFNSRRIAMNFGVDISHLGQGLTARF